MADEKRYEVHVVVGQYVVVEDDGTTRLDGEPRVVENPFAWGEECVYDPDPAYSEGTHEFGKDWGTAEDFGVDQAEVENYVDAALRHGDAILQSKMAGKLFGNKGS